MHRYQVGRDVVRVARLTIDLSDILIIELTAVLSRRRFARVTCPSWVGYGIAVCHKGSKHDSDIAGEITMK